MVTSPVSAATNLTGRGLRSANLGRPERDKGEMDTTTEELLRHAQNSPLSSSLPVVLREETASGDEALAKWARLELLGYYADNPAMTKEIRVPEYRIIRGQWFDMYRRPLVIVDPGLEFINEIPLRAGVLELENFIGTNEGITISMPEYVEMLHDKLHVEVNVFRFTPRTVEQVLAGIKAQLLDRLATRPHKLSQAGPSISPVAEGEILRLQPNLYGVGIDLKALWKRLRSRTPQR
jgi:AbiTii